MACSQSLECCFALLAIPSHASAAAGTCGVDANWFDGYGVPAKASRYGVSAQIEFQNPDLCGNDETGGSFSGVWTMITAASVSHPSSDAARGYAQAGYLQLADKVGDGPCTCISQFSQYTKKCQAALSCTGNPLVTHYDYDNPAGFWTYQVSFGSDGVLHMLSHGAELDSMDYSTSGVWSPDWEGQFSGETGNKESDMVGSTSDKANFLNLQTQASDRSWGAVAAKNMTSLVPTDIHYYQEKSSNADFDIWTIR